MHYRPSSETRGAGRVRHSRARSLLCRMLCPQCREQPCYHGHRRMVEPKLCSRVIPMHLFLNHIFTAHPCWWREVRRSSLFWSLQFIKMTLLLPEGFAMLMKCSCNSRKTSKCDVSSSFHIAFLLEGIFFQHDSVCRAQMSPVAKKQVPTVPLKLCL